MTSTLTPAPEQSQHPQPGEEPLLARLLAAQRWLSAALKRRLDRVYTRLSRSSLNGVAKLIAVIVIGMTFFGCVMILSASSVKMISLGESPFAQLQRQMIFGVAGLAVMFTVAYLPVSLYRNKAVLYSAMILAIVAQIAVLAIGVEVNGNRNWIALGSIQIQPSEIAKVITVLWLALILKNQGDVGKRPLNAFFPAVFGVGLLAFLILLGHDLGTVLVYGAVTCIMIWSSGIPRRVSQILLAAVILISITAMMSSANRRARFWALFGWCEGSVCDQSDAGLAALASGGFWGVGLGQSRQKYNYLPEAHNDYIFAVIGEELGMLGAFLVILFYLGLIFCAVRIITRSADRFIQLASIGILTWLVFQTLINTLMVVGLAPVIGVPLPFISYGGSSLVSSMLAAGLLMAFARQTPLKSLTKPHALLTSVVAPQSKDSELRNRLGKIVAEENKEGIRTGWEPSFDIRNALKILTFFGVGQAKPSRPRAATGPGTPSTRPGARAPQASRAGAEPRSPREEGRRRPASAPQSRPRPAQAESNQDLDALAAKVLPAKKQVRPATAQSQEAQPRKVQPSPAKASPAQPSQPLPVEAQKAPAPQPRQAPPARKLPPGLAPVKQIRAQQEAARKPRP